LHDPRVAIDAKQVTIACRFDQGGLHSVLTLTLAPSVPEPNLLALRIVDARVGLLPMPLGQVLDRISEAARNMGLHLKWGRSSGEPVAAILLPQSDDRPVRVETLRLGDGEIYVEGTTESAKQ
jgi:hypothetical protein